MSIFSLFASKTSTLKAVDLSILGVDMHSHILPGIDDGAKTVKDSVALIKGLYDLGYRHFIATPHVMADLYPNTPENIRQALQRVRGAIAGQKIDVTIDAAAEYMLDDQFADILHHDELLPLPGNHVLVEMGFIAPPPGLHSLLFRLQTKGYRPIIAHPERYGYFENELDNYQPLRDYGCAFQVNMLSLTGYYGSTVQRTAEKLLKAGWVDYLGTDLHHRAHLEELQMALESPAFNRMLGRRRFLNAELSPPKGGGAGQPF